MERVRCQSCGTAVEGRFSLDWVSRLASEQLRFARVFLECRGKIKDVEQALGLSYPTVVARLDEVVTAIQSALPPHPSRSSGPDAAEARRRILDELASGAIDADEAARRLRHS